MNAAIGYIMISVLGGAVGQILLKKGMGGMGPLTLSLEKLGELLWRMGTNPYVIAGLAIYVTGTVFWLVALSRVDLSYAYPFASLSYVVMLIAAWLLFKEDLSLMRLAGTGVVILGVLLISHSG
jgi:multidrug transporter EmrE-like cation transporter